MRHHASPIDLRILDRLSRSHPSGIRPRTSDVVEGTPPLNANPLGMTVHETVTGPSSRPRTSSHTFSIADSRPGRNSSDTQPSWTVHSKVITLSSPTSGLVSPSIQHRTRGCPASSSPRQIVFERKRRTAGRFSLLGPPCFQHAWRAKNLWLIRESPFESTVEVPPADV